MSLLVSLRLAKKALSCDLCSADSADKVLHLRNRHEAHLKKKKTFSFLEGGVVIPKTVVFVATERPLPDPLKKAPEFALRSMAGLLTAPDTNRRGGSNTAMQQYTEVPLREGGVVNIDEGNMLVFTSDGLGSFNTFWGLGPPSLAEAMSKLAKPIWKGQFYMQFLSFKLSFQNEKSF